MAIAPRAISLSLRCVCVQVCVCRSSISSSVSPLSLSRSLDRRPMLARRHVRYVSRDVSYVSNHPRRPRTRRHVPGRTALPSPTRIMLYQSEMTRRRSPKSVAPRHVS